MSIGKTVLNRRGFLAASAAAGAVTQPRPQRDRVLHRRFGNNRIDKAMIQPIKTNI